MNSYCLSCKKYTNDVNKCKKYTNDNRLMMLSKCSVCNNKV